MRAGLLLVFSLSCAPEPGDSEAEVAEAWPEMSARRLLVRISLDLRGIRPSEEEIAAVEADPAALDTLMDAWLEDERFPARLVDLYNDLFLTRSEYYSLDTSVLDLDSTPLFLRSVGEEPLRLLAEVAAEDLPYTALVTADWTMADEQLASVDPLDYPAGETGWKKAHYTDGRPAAGVLSTNGLWWRFVSTDSNANRKRANTVARLFLCEDYLKRPIEFDRNVNLLEDDAVAEALDSNPGCVNCHSSLDPLASYFYGFYWYNYTSPFEAARYHPERENLWATATGVAPGYYGTPGYTLEDLGRSLASDPRFPTCAVEQAFKLLLRREPTLADQERLNAHREAFLAGDLTFRALFRSLVHDAAYRAGDTDDELAVPEKLATVEMLASQVVDLTGFHWTYADYDMLATDTYGLRTLGGGVDGYTVTSSATAPSATSALVLEAVAEASSAYAVAAEQEMAAEDRRLFREIDFDETPESDAEAMVAQIVALHLRIFGNRVDADGEEVAANLALWSDLYAVEGRPAAAWQGLLSALLRDPDFVLY